MCVVCIHVPVYFHSLDDVNVFVQNCIESTFVQWECIQTFTCAHCVSLAGAYPLSLLSYSLSLSLSLPLPPSPLPPSHTHIHTLCSSPLLTPTFQSYEFDVYSRYAENYMEALSHLHTLMEDDEVVKYLESQPTKLFKEAMQYLLPKSLLEPIYHCFYYFEILDVSY